MNRFSVFFAAALIISLTTGQASAVTFTPLGDLPGGEFRSVPNDISVDGRVVVGDSVFDKRQRSIPLGKWNNDRARWAF